MNKGEIWLVALPVPMGHEQAGTRPAIVLTTAEASIAIVVPCTSNIQALRFPHTLELRPSTENGLSALSVALVFHIRAIDMQRLQKKIGTLEVESLVELDRMLKKLLRLP